jgi:hypothetical protein
MTLVEKVRANAPLGAAALSCMLLSACVPFLEETWIMPSTWAEEIEWTLDRAKREGASERQIAILERALDEGAVSYEGAAEANEAFVACIQAKGIPASVVLIEVGDFIFPDYQANTPVELYDDEQAILLTCEQLESRYVLSLYKIQPEAQGARVAYGEQVKPEFVECLKRAGLTVPPDASMDEAVGLALDHESYDTPVTVEDCFDVVDVNPF